MLEVSPSCKLAPVDGGWDIGLINIVAVAVKFRIHLLNTQSLHIFQQWNASLQILVARNSTPHPVDLSDRSSRL